MGLTTQTWAPKLLIESQKFWFYAIATSLLLSLYQLFFTSTPARATAPVVTEKEDATTFSSEKPATVIKAEVENGNTDIYRQLLIDGCDLFIPGAAVGWIPIEPLSVGVFMSISSVLAMGTMWPKIQASAGTAQKK